MDKKFFAVLLSVQLVLPCASFAAREVSTGAQRTWSLDSLSRPMPVNTIVEFGQVLGTNLTEKMDGTGLTDEQLAALIHEGTQTLGTTGPMSMHWDASKGELLMSPGYPAFVPVDGKKDKPFAGAQALRMEALTHRIQSATQGAEIGRAIGQLYDGKPIIETVGVVTEIKANEKRVGLTPDGVRRLSDLGIPVVVQKGAGAGSRFSDEEYAQAGAKLVDSAEKVFAEATLIKHVKELQPSEYKLLKPHHIVFTYNHFEEDADLTKRSIESGATFISYEKVAKGRETPMLAPMSRIAGTLAAYWAAYFGEKTSWEKLKAKTPGSSSSRTFDQVLELVHSAYAEAIELFPAAPSPTSPISLMNKKVVVLGGGIAGFSAAEMALKMGAVVSVTEIDSERTKKIRDSGMTPINASDNKEIDNALLHADVIIGSVYVKGKAPIVLDEARLFKLALARKGRPFLIIDISVDQGGNIAFLQNGPNGPFRSDAKTSHKEPVTVDFFGNQIVRVPNMPAAVPRQASIDLEAATLPYLMPLTRGIDLAFRTLPEFIGGLSIRLGGIVDPRVREAHPHLATAQ